MSAFESQQRSFRSRDLARVAGVSPDTLRHYERLGILKKPPRTESGYRSYPPEALDRVHLIRNALASGFTLRELIMILQMRDGGGSPCRQVAQLAREKVHQLGIRIAQLACLRDSLKLTLRDWGGRLEQMPVGGRAHLLESLSITKNQPVTRMKGLNHEDFIFLPGADNTDGRLRAKRGAGRRSRSASGDK